MTGRDGFYWTFPAAVELTYADGRRELRPFASRLEAEAWIALIPWGQLLGLAEFQGIASAVLVSMLGQGLGQP